MLGLGLMDRDVKEAWAFVALHDVPVGGEHPTRKGWFLKQEIGSRGEPLWEKPPHPAWKWIHRACMGIWLSLMALGIFCAAFIEQ